MPSRKPARTTRRLLKVASLGLAGLLAGLLGGCASSHSLARFSSWRVGSNDLTASRRLQNLDYRRTPEFRRAPVPHHTQPAPVQRTSTQASLEIDAIGHHYDTHAGQ